MTHRINTDNPEVKRVTINTRVAIFGKWTESNGHDADESQEVINSMKKKNLIYWDDEPLYDSEDDILYDDQDPFNISEDMPWVEDWMEGCPYQYELGIITAGYTYHDRLFGIKHFGIEKFQRKWRDYWKKKQEKIMFMKSIKNLKHRAIYGKNPLN